MRLNSITDHDVEEFLRLEPGTYDGNMMSAVRKAAESYILNYTGLTKEQADEKEDLYIAYMVLCQDMFDNRAMYVDKNNVNKVVDSILGMHSVNLIA